MKHTTDDPTSDGYYLIKTVEDKWGILLWEYGNFWFDENQDGKVNFSIKRELVKEWYELPS